MDGDTWDRWLMLRCPVYLVLPNVVRDAIVRVRDTWQLIGGWLHIIFYQKYYLARQQALERLVGEEVNQESLLHGPSNLFTVVVLELGLHTLFVVMFIVNTFSATCMGHDEVYAQWRIITDAVLGGYIFYMHHTFFVRSELRVTKFNALAMYLTTMASTVGLIIYYAVPPLRKTYMGVHALALVHILRLYLLSTSLQLRFGKIQRMTWLLKPVASQLTITSVNLAAHWLAFSALLHILMHIIYSPVLPNFSFLDAMYYVCLTMLNGPSDDIIADTPVTRTVVVVIIGLVFIALPSEIAKLVKAYGSRPPVAHDEALNHLCNDNVFVIGHLTANNVLPLLYNLEHNYRRKQMTVYIMDDQPTSPAIKHAVKAASLPKHLCVKYINPPDLLHLWYIMYTINELHVVVLNDPGQGGDLEALDQKCIAQVMAIVQYFELNLSLVAIHLHLNLESSVLPVVPVPQCEPTCLDFYLVNLLAKSTAAPGLATFLGAVYDPFSLKHMATTGLMNWERSFMGSVRLSPISQRLQVRRLYPIVTVDPDDADNNIPDSVFSINQIHLSAWQTSPLRTLCKQQLICSEGYMARQRNPLSGTAESIDALNTISFICSPDQNVPMYSRAYLGAPLYMVSAEHPYLRQSAIRTLWAMRPKPKPSTWNPQLCLLDDLGDAFSHHVVVIDYLMQTYRTTIPLIEHLKEAHNNALLPIVILCPISVNQDEIDAMENYRNVRFVCRNPLIPSTLERLNVVAAKAVVLLHNPDAEWESTNSKHFCHTQSLLFAIRQVSETIPIIRQLPSHSLMKSFSTKAGASTAFTDVQEECVKPFLSGEGCLLPRVLHYPTVQRQKISDVRQDDLILFGDSTVLHPEFRAQMLRDSSKDTNRGLPHVDLPYKPWAEFCQQAMYWYTLELSQIIQADDGYKGVITFQQLNQGLRRFQAQLIGLSRLFVEEWPKMGRYVLFSPTNECLHHTDHVIAWIPRHLRPQDIAIDVKELSTVSISFSVTPEASVTSADVDCAHIPIAPEPVLPLLRR